MWRSSSVPITQKALSSSRSAGWSNERSHGSDDAGVSPKIGRITTQRRSHFCASLQSGSCSENYAIPRDLSGQILRLGSFLSILMASSEARNEPPLSTDAVGSRERMRRSLGWRVVAGTPAGAEGAFSSASRPLRLEVPQPPPLLPPA